MFDTQTLLQEARSETGLDDFGPAEFVAGLGHLVEDMARSAKLTDIGRTTQLQRIVGLLVNRLRIEAALKQNPAILDEQIAAPVVIVGLPRTGSTMTHRLLASDPAHTAMLWWEGRYPAMLPNETRGDPVQRRALGLAEVEAVAAANPEAMDIHPWDYQGADEEVLLLEHTFHSSVPESFMYLPNYSRWIAEQDHTPVYQDLKRMLQYLQWQNPGRETQRWILKSPHHLGYLDALLSVFPDANIIQTHRSPLDTVPSFASMCGNLTEQLTTNYDPRRVGGEVLNKLSRDLSRCMRVAEAQPDRFLDLRFEDMVRDPIAQMTRVYAFNGESFGDRAEQAMRAYQEDDAHQPGAHQYTLQQFGLSEDQIQKSFAAYIDRYQL